MKADFPSSLVIWVTSNEYASRCPDELHRILILLLVSKVAVILFWSVLIFEVTLLYRKSEFIKDLWTDVRRQTVEQQELLTCENIADVVSFRDVVLQNLRAWSDCSCVYVDMENKEHTLEESHDITRDCVTIVTYTTNVTIGNDWYSCYRHVGSDQKSWFGRSESLSQTSVCDNVRRGIAARPLRDKWRTTIRNPRRWKTQRHSISDTDFLRQWILNNTTPCVKRISEDLQPRSVRT